MGIHETASKIRWGILGAGGIAGAFAWSLGRLPDAELLAVGSRKQETADAFGEKYGIPRRYPGYAALANDPDVDVIYVATPHSLHRENTLLCLNAGKAVLCEKPFAINTTETKEMIETARRKKLFLMEAMWMRFLPLVGHVRQIVSDGVIGEVRQFVGDFGFRAEFDPKNRLFDPALGGGALLDIGIYPVSFASALFGNAPTRIVSMADIGQTGVDEQAAMVFGYKNGALAILSCANRTRMTEEGEILGTAGMIRLPFPWWHPSRAVICLPDEADKPIDMPYEGNGYHYQAAETMRCLREGLFESPVMPLDETLSIMKTLDAVRGQWNLRYPME